MTDHIQGPELVRDDDLTRELRAMYAPPAAEGYWAALEGRVLTALDEADTWWTLPERWERVGLIAAMLAFLVAGGLLLRTQQQAARSRAYETVMQIEGQDETTVATRPALTDEQVAMRRLLGRD